MARLVVNGGRPLEGRVTVRGAKNSALPLLAASILAGEEVTLHRIPRLEDIAVMLDILRSLGLGVETEATPHGLTVHIVPGCSNYHVPAPLTRRMRSSILVMGALLAKGRKVQIAYPGGCVIGSRPIDLHLNGLRKLGAMVTEEGGTITATAPRLRGAHIHLDVPSVGATENLLMAAVLAEGTTIIGNAAQEPEIVDLQIFLNRMGARVRGAGTGTIRVDGVERLGGGHHEVIPDRIEAATYMVAAAISRGDVEIADLIPQHLEAVTAKLREAGVTVTAGDHWLRVQCQGRPRGVDLTTLPYPGYPTDAQNQFLALMCCAEGTSVINETIYEQRLKIAGELRRMGARIHTDGRSAVVRGVPFLTGAQVQASDDLRGAASLVLAGLGARGTTIVEGAQFIDRGYQDFEGTLQKLGAEVYRLNPEKVQSLSSPGAAQYPGAG